MEAVRRARALKRHDRDADGAAAQAMAPTNPDCQAPPYLPSMHFRLRSSEPYAALDTLHLCFWNRDVKVQDWLRIDKRSILNQKVVLCSLFH